MRSRRPRVFPVVAQDVTESLRTAKSGITFSQEYADIGMKSQVYGRPDIDPAEYIDRKQLRFMGDAAKCDLDHSSRLLISATHLGYSSRVHAIRYAYIAMQKAIDDASLTPEQINSPRVGGILGQVCDKLAEMNSRGPH